MATIDRNYQSNPNVLSNINNPSESVDKGRTWSYHLEIKIGLIEAIGIASLAILSIGSYIYLNPFDLTKKGGTGLGTENLDTVCTKQLISCRKGDFDCELSNRISELNYEKCLLIKSKDKRTNEHILNLKEDLPSEGDLCPQIDENAKPPKMVAVFMDQSIRYKKLSDWNKEISDLYRQRSELGKGDAISELYKRQSVSYKYMSDSDDKQSKWYEEMSNTLKQQNDGWNAKLQEYKEVLCVKKT